MPISLTCACGRSAQVKDELAGKKVRCPDCQSILTVPLFEALEDDEDNVADVLPAESSEEPATRSGMQSRAATDSTRLPAGLGESDEEPRRPKRRRPKSYWNEEDRPPRVAIEKGWFGSINGGIIGGLYLFSGLRCWRWHRRVRGRGCRGGRGKRRSQR